MTTATMLSEPTNGAQETIEAGAPYRATITVKGSADLLFHAWNCEAVEAGCVTGGRPKGTKKRDNLESYIYRDGDGVICLPGEYLRMSIIHAAKFRQDPRSPRKSAMDLYKAAITTLSPLSPIINVAGELPKVWDYEDRRRAQVQRAGITRTRPAFKAGWACEVSLMVGLPEYISPAELHEVTAVAGRLIGVGDFRPTYGRFQVTRFEAEPG